MYIFNIIWLLDGNVMNKEVVLEMMLFNDLSSTEEVGFVGILYLSVNPMLMKQYIDLEHRRLDFRYDLICKLKKMWGQSKWVWNRKSSSIEADKTHSGTNKINVAHILYKICRAIF